MVVSGRRTRRRRPAWLVLAVALTAVVLLVNAASRGGDDTPARSLSYLDEVRPLVERSNAQGAELQDLRDRAGELGRAVIAKRLDRLAKESGDARTQAARLEPPEKLVTAHGLLLATFAARAHGTKALKDALGQVLGSAPPESVVQSLLSAGRDLVAADRNYALFVDEAPMAEDAALPTSQWVADPATWEQAELQLFVFGLRASSTIQPVHDTAVVTFATEPAAVATGEGGVKILPVAKTIKLQVVVANAGNEPVKRVQVIAELSGVDGGGVDTARDFVDLAPGQRATVQLGGLRPAPTGASLLKVRVGPVEGEANPGDNERTLTFTMR